MRATILSALFLALTGALAMSTAVADDKDEKKETKGKITVKRWDAQGKKFLDPAEVDARRVEYKGEVWYYVPVDQAIGTGQPLKGSEIKDADGKMYVVKTGSSTGMGEYRASVEKKP